MGRHKRHVDPNKKFPDQAKAVEKALRNSRSKAHAAYSDEAIVLALSVIQGGGSLRDACTAVQQATGKRPHSGTVHKWTERNAEAFGKLQPEKRREWESLAGQVFEAWSRRALEAAEAKKEDGSYVVSHQQAMVPFGIAKDGLRSVLEAVQSKGMPVAAVQVNITSGGKRLPDDDEPATLDVTAERIDEL